MQRQYRFDLTLVITLEPKILSTSKNKQMASRKNTARYAGLLYLLMAATAASSLMTMPSSIIVKGHALQTAQNLVAQETTVRWVIILGLTKKMN